MLLLALNAQLSKGLFQLFLLLESGRRQEPVAPRVLSTLRLISVSGDGRGEGLKGVAEAVGVADVVVEAEGGLGRRRRGRGRVGNAELVIVVEGQVEYAVETVFLDLEMNTKEF